MGTPAVTPNATPDVPGLPPGAVVRPLAQSAGGGLPPGAVVKPLGGTGAQNQNDSNPLTANPNGEGLYQMKGPQGAVAVPYSKVATAQQQGLSFADGEEARHTWDALHDPQRTPVSSGLAKDAVQLPNTLAGWLDELSKPLVKYGEAKTGGKFDFQPGDARKGLEGLEEKLKPGVTQPAQGAGEHIGAVLDQILQFGYGEGEAKEAIQGMSLAEKFARAGKLTKMLEEHPNIAAYLRRAPEVAQSVASNSAAGTGVALAHGADPKEALTQGAEAGATAGLTEGVAQGVGAARENVARYKAGGEALERNMEAAEAAGAAKTAAVKQQAQQQAQGQVKDVARQAARGALERINEARPIASTGLPTGEFAPVDAEAASGKVASFKDAADTIREHVRLLLAGRDGA